MTQRGGDGGGGRSNREGIYILVVDSHCCPAEITLQSNYTAINIKKKDVAGEGILEAVYIKDRRLLTTLQTRHCLHTLFPWIILKPSKRYERMTETEGGMFPVQTWPTEHPFISSVLNSSKVGNIFWKAMEHFAQMKLHPLALNTDPQKQEPNHLQSCPEVLPTEWGTKSMASAGLRLQPISTHPAHAVCYLGNHGHLTHCVPHISPGHAPCLSHSWGLLGSYGWHSSRGLRQEPYSSITLGERRMWSRDSLT